MTKDTRHDARARKSEPLGVRQKIQILSGEVNADGWCREDAARKDKERKVWVRRNWFLEIGVVISKEQV